MTTKPKSKLGPYRQSLTGTLLSAREAAMAPLRPILRSEGLSEPQWRVLRILIDEGAMDLTSLARTAILHPPSVTRLIRDMTTKGLLEREPDADDKRRSILRISDEGRRIFDRASIGTTQILEHYNAYFGSKRLEHLRHELAEFAEILAQFPPPEFTLKD